MQVLQDVQVDAVSGGDNVPATIGQWVGTVIEEVNQHPVGALFGPTGVIIAHLLTKQ